MINKQPHNYFQDIEQACFSPSNMVPGIGPTADPSLQPLCIQFLKDMYQLTVTAIQFSKLECSATLMPTATGKTHRLIQSLESQLINFLSVGPNYFQLPCNRPINKVYAPYVRDGPGTINGNYGGDPDYVFSQLRPVAVTNRVQVPTYLQWSGKVVPQCTSLKDKDFEQPRALWKIICSEPDGRDKFLHNILPTIKDIPDDLKKQVVGE